MTRVNHNTAPFVPLSEMKNQLTPGVRIEVYGHRGDPFTIFAVQPARHPDDKDRIHCYDFHTSIDYLDFGYRARLWLDAPCPHDYPATYARSGDLDGFLHCGKCGAPVPKATPAWPEPPYAFRDGNLVAWAVTPPDAGGDVVAVYLDKWATTEREVFNVAGVSSHTPQPGDMIPLWPILGGCCLWSTHYNRLEDLPTLHEANKGGPPLRLALELPPVWVRKE